MVSFLKYTPCWLRNSHILWFVTVCFTFLSVYFALLFLSLHWTLSVQVPLLLPWNNWIAGPRKPILQSYLTSSFSRTYLFQVRLSGNWSLFMLHLCEGLFLCYLFIIHCVQPKKTISVVSLDWFRPSQNICIILPP